MATDSHSFTPETARQFDRYSIANAVTVKRALPCGCEPYTQVFTYRRWKAQGFQVQRGERALRLPLIYSRTETDPQTGEKHTAQRAGPRKPARHLAILGARCRVPARVVVGHDQPAGSE